MKVIGLVLVMVCPAVMPAQRVATEDSDALAVSGKLSYHFAKAYSPCWRSRFTQMSMNSGGW